MKTLNFLICATLLFGFTTFSPENAALEKTAIIFLNDDSGAITNAEDFNSVRELGIRQMHALRNQRKFARADLIFISTSRFKPVTHGTVQDLNTAWGQEVLDKIKNNPSHCNPLTLAFDAVRTQIKLLTQRGVENIHVLVFSSLISTNIPCGEPKIVLPQIPVDVDWVESLAGSEAVKTVAFYLVNAAQTKAYLEAMEPLAEWGNQDDHSFALFDFESSANDLRFGLWGISK